MFSYYKYFWKELLDSSVVRFGEACWMTTVPVDIGEMETWVRNHVLGNNSASVVIESVKEISIIEYLQHCKKTNKTNRTV